VHPPDGSLLGRGWELDVGADDVEVGEDSDELVGECAVRLQVGFEAEVAERWEKLEKEVGVEQGLAAGEGDGVVEAGLGSGEAGYRFGDVLDGERIGRFFEVLGSGASFHTARRRLGTGRRRVAIGAVEVAPEKAEKDLALAEEEAFALDGGEDFEERGSHFSRPRPRTRLRRGS